MFSVRSSRAFSGDVLDTVMQVPGGSSRTEHEVRYENGSLGHEKPGFVPN